jgi:3-oxoadipate CoA-transferase alpha subunit
VSIKGVYDSPVEAVSYTPDGATVLVGGFGSAGQPVELVEARAGQRGEGPDAVEQQRRRGDTGLALLMRERRVREVVCSFPRQSDSWHFEAAYGEGVVELELVPQGMLAERIRAGGAGIGAFFTPTAYGTPLSEGKETRILHGRWHVLEHAITGDVALVAAHRADELGSLVYRKTARNFRADHARCRTDLRRAGRRDRPHRDARLGSRL